MTYRKHPMSDLVKRHPELARDDLLITIARHGGMTRTCGRGRRANEMPASVSLAARELGVSPPTMRAWLRRVGIRSRVGLARAIAPFVPRS